MYPHLLSTDDIAAMHAESVSHHVEANFDNLENNKPTITTGTNIKTRHALFKKGSRGVRSPASNNQNSNQRSQQQHQKHGLLKISNPVRLSDINNNAITARPKSPLQPNTEVVTNKSQAAVTSTHQIKVGSKKELLKSKTGRPERASQLSNQTNHGPSKCEQTPQNVTNRAQKSKCSSAAVKASSKKSENSRQRLQSGCKEVKKPLSPADNIRLVNLCQSACVLEDSPKDGEKVYAGAKFSEPPSPSVLPKPPSHWVGDGTPQCRSDGREQMTSHLKSLLKVPDKVKNQS